jgi:hypothetical protein
MNCTRGCSTCLNEDNCLACVDENELVNRLGHCENKCYINNTINTTGMTFN